MTGSQFSIFWSSTGLANEVNPTTANGSYAGGSGCTPAWTVAGTGPTVSQDPETGEYYATLTAGTSTGTKSIQLRTTNPGALGTYIATINITAAPAMTLDIPSVTQPGYTQYYPTNPIYEGPDIIVQFRNSVAIGDGYGNTFADVGNVVGSDGSNIMNFDGQPAGTSVYVGYPRVNLPRSGAGDFGYTSQYTLRGATAVSGSQYREVSFSYNALSVNGVRSNTPISTFRIIKQPSMAALVNDGEGTYYDLQVVPVGGTPVTGYSGNYWKQSEQVILVARDVPISVNFIYHATNAADAAVWGALVGRNDVEPGTLSRVGQVGNLTTWQYQTAAWGIGSKFYGRITAVSPDDSNMARLAGVGGTRSVDSAKTQSVAIVDSTYTQAEIWALYTASIVYTD
jgi:hypothetical protein